jgi:hypothetical protein
MDRVRTLGAATTLVALAGYVVGVYAPFPGRGFTVTGLMVGLTLWAVGERG